MLEPHDTVTEPYVARRSQEYIPEAADLGEDVIVSLNTRKDADTNRSSKRQPTSESGDKMNMEDVIPPAPMPKTASNPIHEDRNVGGKKSLNTSTERLNKGSQMTSSSPEIPCDTEQARVETKPIKVQTILNKQLVKSPYLEEDKLLRSN